MMPTLYHFSEEPSIAVFHPRTMPHWPGVELRVMERLTPLYGLWETTTLHWSSIRMTNAQDWTSNPRTVPARLRP